MLAKHVCRAYDSSNMTSKPEADPTDALFSSLAAIHMDPVLTRGIDQMRTYNELLVSQPMNQAEINELIREQDVLWETFMKKEAIFSGYAQPSEHEADNGEPQRLYFEKQHVTFRGAFPDEQEHLAYSSGDPETPLFYKLFVMIEYEGIDREGEFGKTTALVELNDLVSLDFVSEMSPEHARHLLENFQPDLLDDIDEALLASVEHEAELAQRLAGLFYDQSGDESRTIDQTSLALTVYTNALVKFDENLGYAINIQGQAWKMEGETYKRGGIHQVVPAKIHKISWLTSPDMGDDTIVPHLTLQFCGADVNTTSEVFHIPLTSVEQLDSLRYQFYKA